MAKDTNTKVRGGSRDGGSFLALPWSVLDSAAYKALSHPARSLLLDVGRQYMGANNGQLLTSMRKLKERGWTSSDTVNRAKKELVSAGFLYETVKGHRPNKASWYAITWFALDRLPGYDPGTIEGYERSAFRKNKVLKPAPGEEQPAIAPSGGTGSGTVVPWPGAARPTTANGSRPPDGNHLEKPSVQRRMS